QPIAAEALRGKAEMHRAWAGVLADEAADEQYELALESFEEYAKKYSDSPNFPYVMLDIARLNQDVFFRIGPARQILETIISRFPTHAAADRAEYQYGMLLLTEGDLEAARIQFERLQDRVGTGDLAESARYQ